MLTFSFISQKGGAGKSTLARQLAVLAAESGRSVLIDRDPQATTTKWWSRRQELADAPDLLDLKGTDLERAVAALRDHPGTLLIDTRPSVAEPEAEAVRVADLVVVPVRPSGDDLEAIGDTLKMVARLKRRAVVVVNAAKNEARAVAARAALSVYPFPVCPHHLGDRAAFLDAATDGRGVAEMKGQAARDAEAELRKVWTWLQEIAHDQETP